METYTKSDLQNWKSRLGNLVLRSENISGRYIAMLAAASIFLDIYNYFSFSFVSFSFLAVFPVSSALFGLSVVAVNIGAAVGTLSGGILTDKYGRKVMFLINMVLFTVMAIITAVSTNFWEFTSARIVLGFALGADIPTGMAYLFEFLDQRRRMRYSFMTWNGAWGIIPVISVGLVLAIGSVTGFAGAGSLLIWRIVLGLGAVFAVAILVLRSRLPESALWLAHTGNFKEAKRIVKSVYNTDFPDIPDLDLSKQEKRSLSTTMFGAFKVSKIANRIYIQSFLLSFLVSIVFWGFAFYVPQIITALNFGTTIVSKLILQAGLFSSIIIGAVLAMVLHHRVGIKQMTTVSTFVMAFFFLLLYLTAMKVFPIIMFLPFTFIILLTLTIGPVSFFAVLNPVIPPEFRGSINGWVYTVNKIGAIFSGLYGAIIFASLGLEGNSLLMLFMSLAFGIAVAVIGVNTKKVDIEGLENMTVAKVQGSTRPGVKQ